jgi:hypothetical protein
MNEWIRKGAVVFSLATSKVEKDLLAQNESEDILRNNHAIINPYSSNKLMNDLKQGNVTREVKEFRRRHYQILKESAKYKFKNGQLLSEEEAKHMKITQGDPHDTYPVEVVFNNKPIGAALYGTQEIRPLKVKRGVVPRYKIENHTSVVHIRNVDGEYKLLDFYIPKSTDNHLLLNELENLKLNKKINDLVNITECSFTTQDSEMLNFSYKVVAFHKVVEYNNNYIVKLFAEVVEDGRWIADWTQIID